MYFSRKTLLTKGKKPLYAASRVLNASSATASNAFAKCWVHSTNKTSALIRSVKTQGLRRAYSTGKSGAENGAGSGMGMGGMGLPPGSGVPLYRKLVNAWTETPTKWYPLPIAVGALLLVAIQYRRKSKRERLGLDGHGHGHGEPEVEVDENGIEVIRLKGPWQVHVLGALPLRNVSRLWGYLNSLELPIWFRPYGFKLYAYAFGCNLEEIDPPTLESYVSLGDFFYRKLKDGVRPVDDAVLVSPADGRILHFGKVEIDHDDDDDNSNEREGEGGEGRKKVKGKDIRNMRVEQVKGISYSLDALLGVEKPNGSQESLVIHFDDETHYQGHDHGRMEIVDHHEFANLNGIEYSLEQLIGDDSSSTSSNSSSGISTPSSSIPSSPNPNDIHPHDKPKKYGAQIDASIIPTSTQDMKETIVHDTSVAIEMGNGTVNGNGNGIGNGIGNGNGKPTIERKQSLNTSTSTKKLRPGNDLFFTVIYLAPGDYHRFHSPTAWVVEKRRHFIGELFSVSPYIAKRLQNLFILNERVSLLGRWKYGFFSMVPVGATNVGSIILNFDKDLKTNEPHYPHPSNYSSSSSSTSSSSSPSSSSSSLSPSSPSSTSTSPSPSPKSKRKLPPIGTYTEATYYKASSILKGQPLLKSQEMGGFCLGSTIVLVFEAPKDFEFCRNVGEKVRVGERLGDLVGVKKREGEGEGESRE